MKAPERDAETVVRLVTDELQKLSCGQPAIRVKDLWAAVSAEGVAEAELHEALARLEDRDRLAVIGGNIYLS